MQIKYYPLLLSLPVLPALAAPPLPQQQPQQSTPKAASQTLSTSLPVGQDPNSTPSPTPLAPPPAAGKPPSSPPINPPQQPKLLLKSHDGTEATGIPVASCEQPTPTSPKTTDVQTLSKHYQSQQLSSLPPLELAKDVRACVPLESVPGSNAKIELCGQDVFVSYSDVGKLIDVLLAACTRGEDGAAVDGSLVNGRADTAAKVAWTAGAVSAMVEGKVLVSVRVVRK